MLAACDIGVLPESNEYGQPMKLLEYAAAGLAIVAPDLPPVRAIIDDGVTGLLFPPGDVTGLTRALDRLLRDRAMRTRLGTQARSRIAAAAGWDQRGRELTGTAAHPSPSTGDGFMSAQPDLRRLFHGLSHCRRGYPALLVVLSYLRPACKARRMPR
jgi:hypothetical protein